MNVLGKGELFGAALVVAGKLSDGQLNVGLSSLVGALCEAQVAATELALKTEAEASDEVARALGEIDPPQGTPIVVVAAGDDADAAVHGSSCDARIAGLVLVSPRLSADAVGLAAEWDQVPILTVAATQDRRALKASTTVYLGSSHPGSDIDVVSEPEDAAVLDRIICWVTEALAAAGQRTDVVCSTDDGWEIHGTMTVPQVEAERVPGVVLLHSGRSDRAVFARTERLLVRRGLATVSIDWRGRGRSTNRGTYFELDASERAEGWRDARAAADLLAEHPRVDGDRMAMVGIVHGAEHAVTASIGDDRIKALVLLTGYMPRTPEEEAHLVSGVVDVMYVSSEGHVPVTEAMRDLASRSDRPRTRLRVYPGGAIGYQLFEIDPALEGEIAGWLAEGLPP